MQPHIDVSTFLTAILICVSYILYASRYPYEKEERMQEPQLLFMQTIYDSPISVHDTRRNKGQVTGSTHCYYWLNNCPFLCVQVQTFNVYTRWTIFFLKRKMQITQVVSTTGASASAATTRPPSQKKLKLFYLAALLLTCLHQAGGAGHAQVQRISMVYGRRFHTANGKWKCSQWSTEILFDKMAWVSEQPEISLRRVWSIKVTLV